jgi:SanA protein
VKGKLWRKRIFRIGALVLGLGIAFVWATNIDVLSSASGLIFTDASTVPKSDVALVLGTSPHNSQGGPNLFFERRMNAAAEIYRAKRVKKLLVSGDNGSAYYDEPNAMKAALMQRGIPESDIVLDFAGFRTLDSVVRAHKVFGVQQCLIVTDDFHLPRALFIANQEGMNAVGFQTQPLPRRVSPWTFIREVGARSLVWLDVRVFNRQPKFLGPKETIVVSKR